MYFSLSWGHSSPSGVRTFLKHQFFKLLIIHSFSPAPPREGLFCALSGVTADTFMVLAVFFKLIDSIWQHLA